MASSPKYAAYHGTNQRHKDASATEVFAARLLAEQVCVVTGGGSGIGLEIALELGKLGGTVVISGRNEEKLQAAAKLLATAGVIVDTLICDIRDADACSQFVQAILQRHGRLDVLVNNAGGQFASLAENVSPKGFAAVVRNNLLGTWNMIHAAATLAFIPQRSGRVVNITANVFRGFPTMVHTGAARSGVENITKTLAVEWSRFNISINSVAPGIITSHGSMTNYGTEGDAMLDGVARTIPLQRTGTCAEVAHMITFLASQRAASYITGQTFYVDGGSSLWGDTFTAVMEREQEESGPAKVAAPASSSWLPPSKAKL